MQIFTVPEISLVTTGRKGEILLNISWVQRYFFNFMLNPRSKRSLTSDALYILWLNWNYAYPHLIFLYFFPQHSCKNRAKLLIFPTLAQFMHPVWVKLTQWVKMLKICGMFKRQTKCQRATAPTWTKSYTRSPSSFMYC